MAARQFDLSVAIKTSADMRAAENAAAAVTRVRQAEVAAAKEAQAASRAAAAAERQRAQEAAKASRAETQRRTQLAFQTNDIATSLASGMNPLMVLAQQGGQITQIYGGVGATFRALGAALGPVGLAVGGVAAAVAAGTVAWIAHSNSMREVTTAYRVFGSGSGATRGQMEAIAQAAASQAGIAVGAARSIEAALVKTGRIGVEQFGGLIGMSQRFADVVGSDLDAAGQTLAQLFADPAKGAQELAEKYGLIDGATERLIRRLVDQGKVSEAQTRLQEALKTKLEDAGQTVAGYTALWRSLGQQVSNVADSIGAEVDSILASTGALLAQARGARTLADGLSVVSDGAQEFLGYLAGKGPDAQSERIAATEAAAREAARRRAAEVQRRRVEDARAGDLAVSVARGSPVNQAAARLRQLETDLGALERGRAAANLTDGERASINTAIEAKTRALQSYIPEAERVQRLAQLDRQISAAATEAERSALRGKRELLSLAGEEITTAEAEARAKAAATKEVGKEASARRSAAADLLASQRERLDLLEAELRLVGASEPVRARQLALIEAENRLRADGISGAAAEAVRANAVREADLQASLQQARASRDVIASQRDHLELLEAELRLVGASEPVRARQLALLQAEQRIRADGITGQNAETIRANAGREADLIAGIERAKASYDGLRQAGMQAFDTLADGLLDAADRTRSLADVGRSVARDLLREFTRLAAVNPLKNMLFDTQLPTLNTAGGGGMLSGIGSWLANLFHDGGLVGEPTRAARLVSPGVFEGARRFHGGGLVAGERPIIAREGEGVFTPRQMNNADRLFSAAMSPLRPVAGGAAAAPVNVQVINQAGAQVETTSSTGADGSRQLDIRIRKLKREMAAEYGLRPVMGRPG